MCANGGCTADMRHDIDVRRYGTNAARKNVTHFRQREVSKLDPPSLNISAHYLPKSYLDYYMHHNNFQPPGEEIPIYGSLPKITLQDQSRMAWSDVDNFTYSQSDVNEGGKCQPTKVSKIISPTSHQVSIVTTDRVIRPTNGASPSSSSSS